jgi:outer membrane protein assembly factor BamB
MQNKMIRSKWSFRALAAACVAAAFLGIKIWPAMGAEAAGQATTENPANWPQWRGIGRDGRAAPSAPWPDRIGPETLKPSWRVGLGPSYSGPIVSDSLVFVTETKDQRRETVRALDRQTGAQRWETGWDGALSVPFFAKANGDWIRATPACDGESLFVAGMRDVLVCLDALSGATRWRVDFVQELGTPVPDFGFVCSPLVDGEHVYVQAGAAFCKLDKRTGKILWRTLQDEGGMYGSAFSSPVIADFAGARQLLVQTRERLAGVDLETGNVLWSQPIPAFRGMNILTPTVSGNSVFTSAYGGKSFLYRVGESAAAGPLREVWTNKVSGYMSSPVIVDGHLYLHLQSQRFTCIELATGASRWTTQPFGKYWSLVANGDKILALDERGELILIRANPEKFEQLDRRQISSDPTWAHLAVCGDEIFIRELNAMSAYRWRVSK